VDRASRSSPTSHAGRKRFTTRSSGIDAQAEARGKPRDEMLEDVLLAPQAVKRLPEPEEVANVVGFLMGEGGRAFSGVPVTMDLGWTAR
jgi:3-hydroxybutyrate dehydrogenase